MGSRIRMAGARSGKTTKGLADDVVALQPAETSLRKLPPKAAAFVLERHGFARRLRKLST